MMRKKARYRVTAWGSEPLLPDFDDEDIGQTEKLIAAALPAMEAVQLRITAELNREKENFCQQLNRWRDK